MASLGRLSTREIADVFNEEVAEAGGRVTDRFDDGSRLFLRSVLPGERAVGYRDMVRGGVALRAAEGEVRVHPYIFREVCKNGAIVAHALPTWGLEESPFSTLEPAEAIREAVRACCAPEAFEATSGELASSRTYQVDMALMMGVMLSGLPAGAGPQLVEEIARRLFASKDRSAFGLINAVTSLARDTADPDIRWRLEEFGGGIPALARDPRPRLDRARGLVPMGV